MFYTNVYAQSPDTDENNNAISSVVIIGSRFPATADWAPPGASVITANEIRDAGIDNVNEAIRKLAGVYGRQNSRGTTDFDIDLSGFGIDSSNNLVVLVDGIRLSESEMAVPLLSSIPIDSVARIEIMRGGSSVLYGEGATGGVIQIITKQTGPTPLAGYVIAEGGQFNYRAARVALSRGWDQLNWSLNLSDLASDNYRVNNAMSQQNINGALTWYMEEGRVGVRLDRVHQKFGFPGALNTFKQFEQDPRQSLTPFDHGVIVMDRVTAFAEKKVGAWQAAAELSTRQQTVQSDLISMYSQATYNGCQTTFAPRLRYSDTIVGILNEAIVGFDLMDWDRKTQSNYSQEYATQQSRAFYFRDEANLEKTRFSIGARREVVDKSSVDIFISPQNKYNVVQSVNAWELQASYAMTPMIKLFTKAGQSYRLANVDDNAYTAIPNKPLLPQLSHDLEVGTEWGGRNQQVTLRFFRHRLSNEIYFDPLVNHGLGANVNLDSTRRQGVTLDVKWRLSPQFRFSAQFQHVNAELTEGINEGKELSLVPKNAVFAHINWASGDGKKAYVGAQWASTQRYGGDFTNSCSGVIPSYTSVDARYSQEIGRWELAIAATNVLDKPYFTNAYGCMSGIYPNNGRQAKVALRYGF